MSLLIEHLRRFNAKERFFLIGHALGNELFTLGDTFRENLSAKIGIPVPKSAFVAMDYHLDWIYASLHLAKHGEPKGPIKNEDDCIQGNQEDIDLLVGFDHKKEIQLIFLEAKGVTNWLNYQMKSKAKRLRAIFGDDGERWPGIVPRFLMVSPGEPQRVNAKTWPAWMIPGGKVPWLELPGTGGRSCIVRCDGKSKETSVGEYWTVNKRKA